MKRYWLGKHREEGSKPPSRKGIPNSENQKRLISKKLTGIKRSQETRIKMSIAKTGKEGHTAWNKGIKFIQISGENHPNWKGGITPINRLLRCSAQWQIWRNIVFLRDNFTCQNPNCEFCHNQIGVKLHPHHIKPLALFPELAFDVDNGITYCEDFHLKSGLHKQMKEIQCKNMEVKL